MTDRIDRTPNARHFAPAVLMTGLLNLVANVVSIPIFKEFKGPILNTFPVISRLDWQSQQRITSGIYIGTLSIAVLGSAACAVGLWRARRGKQSEPSYWAFRPFIWTAVINLSVIGIVYVAAKLH
jgi:hypothetical protein